MAASRILAIGPQAIGPGSTQFQLQGLRSMRSVRVFVRQANNHFLQVGTRVAAATDRTLARLYFTSTGAGGMAPVELPWFGDDARILVDRQVAGTSTFEAEVEFSDATAGPIAPVEVLHVRQNIGISSSLEPPQAIEGAFWSRASVVWQSAAAASALIRPRVEGVLLGDLVEDTHSGPSTTRFDVTLHGHAFEPRFLNDAAVAQDIAVRVLFLP